MRNLNGIDINTYATIGVKIHCATEKDYTEKFRDEDEGFTTIFTDNKLPLANEIAEAHPEFLPMAQKIRANMMSFSENSDSGRFFDLWNAETKEMFGMMDTLGSVPEFMILLGLHIGFMVTTVNDPNLKQAATNTMLKTEQVIASNPSDEYSFPAHAILCCALWYSDYKGYRAAFRHRLAQRMISGDGGNASASENTPSNPIIPPPRHRR